MMRRVLLVFSVHRPTGAATARELHWLLGCLRPDVLFLEHPSTGLSSFLDGSCLTLESAAVRHYRRFNAVELVPVDSDLNAAELRPKFDELFDRIEEASPKYCQLRGADRQYTETGGFAYLNSPEAALLQSEIQREMRAVVEAAGDPALVELYALWTRTNDLRELAMLGGVEAFAREISFRKGVLLVGSGHRETLYEKSRLPQAVGPSPVTWDFDGRLEDEAYDADIGRGGGPTDRGALG